MSERNIDSLSARLDVLIRILLERERKDNKGVTLGDQIVMLESTGLKGKDVSKILGIDVGQLPSYRRTAKKIGKRSLRSRAVG